MIVILVVYFFLRPVRGMKEIEIFVTAGDDFEVVAAAQEKVILESIPGR